MHKLMRQHGRRQLQKMLTDRERELRSQIALQRSGCPTPRADLQPIELEGEHRKGLRGIATLEHKLQTVEKSLAALQSIIQEEEKKKAEQLEREQRERTRKRRERAERRLSEFKQKYGTVPYAVEMRILGKHIDRDRCGGCGRNIEGDAALSASRCPTCGYTICSACSGGGISIYPGFRGVGPNSMNCPVCRANKDIE